jgi:hypothetical protein
MVHRSDLLGQVFQVIEHGQDGHRLWNLLEEITHLHEGMVYMTFGGETPASLAEKLDRQYFLKIIRLHQKLNAIRLQF